MWGWRSRPQSDGIEKPKKLSEVPGFIGKKIWGFTSRLFYIIGLVWQAAPAVLIVMMLLCVLDGVLPVIGAYISRDLLNTIATLLGSISSGTVAEDVFNTMKPLIFLFIMHFSYLFLRKILTRINSTVNGIAGELVVNHIKLKIINKAKTVDLRSFDRPEFYEKLENANREAGMRPLHILSATFSVISAVISAISFVAVLATLSPFAPLFIIIAAIPGATVNYIYRHRNFRYMRGHSKERREMSYYSGIMTNREKAKEVKILGLSDTFISKYKQVFAKYYAGLKKLMIKEGVTQVLVGLVSTVVNCFLFVFVAYNVIFENGQIGDYSLYTGALNSISSYVTTLLSSTATIYEGTLFINNMIEFMKEEVTVVPCLENPRIPERGVPHTIEFRDVSFAYPGTERNVIDHVNLTLNASETVVLVGLNGAGKTTLIKLLTRLYDPTEGQILLDGYDLREYDTAALYDMFGIIFQDFGRYAESAAENIEFGDIDREHTREDVVTAAMQGNAHDFIEALPRGYDTPLTRQFEDDGIELSGGQWQKLSVSRAFFKKSDFLILDEPTAALDPMAEQEIFNQFTALAKDKITIFVSHRLSSAVTATKIVVLDGGGVAEVGNHEELMALKGKYFTLFSTQAKRYTGIDYSSSNEHYAEKYFAEKLRADADGNGEDGHRKRKHNGDDQVNINEQEHVHDFPV